MPASRRDTSDIAIIPLFECNIPTRIVSPCISASWSFIISSLLSSFVAVFPQVACLSLLLPSPDSNWRRSYPKLFPPVAPIPPPFPNSYYRLIFRSITIYLLKFFSTFLIPSIAKLATNVNTSLPRASFGNLKSDRTKQFHYSGIAKPIEYNAFSFSTVAI